VRRSTAKDGPGCYQECYRDRAHYSKDSFETSSLKRMVWNQKFKHAVGYM
jgi:hypothetical protein